MATLFALVLIAAIIASIVYARKKMWMYVGFGVAAIVLSIVGISFATPSHKIETKQLQVKSTINCNTTNKDDATLAKGTTKVTQDCKNGERTIAYSVTYKDGTEQSRKEISNVITTAAVDKIIANGTYVAPAPTPQPMPTPAPSTPSNNGATALCVDGTYSYAANHQGACSHHGGVSVWYQ
jgi:hypothetical protein